MADDTKKKVVKKMLGDVMKVEDDKPKETKAWSGGRSFWKDEDRDYWDRLDKKREAERTPSDMEEGGRWRNKMYEPLYPRAGKTWGFVDRRKEIEEARSKAKLPPLGEKRSAFGKAKQAKEQQELFPKAKVAKPIRDPWEGGDKIDDLWCVEGVAEWRVTERLPEMNRIPDEVLSLARGDVYPLREGDFRFRLPYRSFDKWGQSGRMLMTPDTPWWEAWRGLEAMSGKGTLVRLELGNTIYDTLTRRFVEVKEWGVRTWKADEYKTKCKEG